MHRNLFAAAVLALVAAGCADLSSDPPTAWRASLTPVSPDGPMGTLAAAFQGGSIEAGLDVLGEPSTAYGWQINRGTCAVPGERVGGRGAYTDVVTSAQGGGRLERTFINSSLREGERYHGVIVQANDRSVILACGELEQLSF